MKMLNLKGVLVIAIACLFFICCSSCKKDNECLETGITQGNIQGNWGQYYGVYEPNFTHPNEYHFKFSSDSFYVAIRQFSDILGDSNRNCQMIDYTEYVRGKYTIHNNQTIVLDGVFTNADYSVKTGGCYRTGAYNEKYDGYFCNDTLVLEWQNKVLAGDFYKDYRIAKMGKE